jgi:hypothetical protein
MPYPAVTADFIEALDVPLELTAQLPLDLIFLGQKSVEQPYLLFGQLLNPGGRLDGSIELL